MPLTESPGAGRLVDVGDTRLFVVEKSLEGLPLICLHGGPGFDHWAFGEYLDGLAPDLRPILVDQRGHGMSDPVLPETLTVARLAEDAIALAEALELDEFAVLGHSFGGFVALRLAVEHADAPRALVLVSTAASVEHPPQPEGEQLAAEDLRRAFEEQAPRLFGADDDPRVGEWLRATAPMVFRPETIAAFRRNGIDHDVAGRLGEIRAPALVIAGSGDRVIAPSESEVLAQGIRGARLAVLEGGGHLPYVEDREAFLDAVRSFLL